MGKRSKKYKANRVPKDPLIHPTRTNPKGYQYFFHPKHHIPRQGNHACWLSTIPRAMEFSIFETAVRLDLGDEDGHLYNVRKDEHGDLMQLGHDFEQIAKFWKPRSEMEWHGFPAWPLRTRQANSRKQEKHRPSRLVFDKLVKTNQLTAHESFRLKKGDDA